MSADGHEDRVEAALVALGCEILDLVVTDHRDAEAGDTGDLRVEHVPRQPVGRDPVPHHPARLAAGIANLDLVAEAGQVVGGREPAGARTDDEHTLAAPRGRRLELPALLACEVAQEALDRMDRHRSVELGPVADALARVVADPAVDRGQRVVGDEFAPRLLVPSRSRMREPGLDVLPGGAARIARRQQVHVHRAASPNGAGPRGAVEQIGQRCDVACLIGHGCFEDGSTIEIKLRSHCRSIMRNWPRCQTVKPLKWRSGFGAMLFEH